MKSFSERADFVINYLECILPKQLEVIGSSADSVKSSREQWLSTVGSRKSFITVMGPYCLRIPIQDAFEMVFIVPIHLSRSPGIKSLWFCPEDSCVYTHHRTGLSDAETFMMMYHMRKITSIRHPVLWRYQLLKRAPIISAPDENLESKQEKNVMKEDADAKKAQQTDGIVTMSDDHENPFTLDILKCQGCSQYYNLLERYPMTLVPCGHSVCAQCVEEANVCPNCHSLFAFSFITIALLGTMRAIQEGRFRETVEEAKVMSSSRKHDRSTSPMNAPESSHLSDFEPAREVEMGSRQKIAKKVDKSKLIIRGLNNEFTLNKIIEKLFQSQDGLLVYKDRPDISLKVEEESMTCIANFINKEEAQQAWYNCRCSIRDLRLAGANVDYLEIGEEVGAIDEKKNGPSRCYPEMLFSNSQLDRTSLFISGLPLRFSEVDVIEVIFGGRKHLNYYTKIKPIILVNTGEAQNCVAHLIDESVTRRCIIQWNSCLMENDRRLIVECLGLASRQLSKNYAKLEERRKLDKKSMEQEYDDTQRFLNDSIKYEKKLLISGFPNSSSRYDVKRSLINDGFEENQYANVYLKPMGVFQNALLYFKEESLAKELQKRWRGKSFGGGMQIMLRLLDIDDSEIYHEETIKGRLVDLGLHRSKLPHRPLPHVAPQKRYRDVRFPEERNPFKLFISGIPPSFHLWDIIEKILGGKEEIATNEGKLAILIGDTLDGSKNCSVRFHTTRAAEMVLNKTRYRVINKEFRLFAEYFGDAPRNFVYNYGARVLLQ